ncbi:MAG TPA: sulfopyruvate decarboxylase subunit alpha [Methanoregulaceae archaeon]|nr:sulfopyruvate decarboxylase subunit alpha [Methanoregulaceae archaeon]
MFEDQVIRILKEQQIDLVASLPCDKTRDLHFLLPEHFRHIGLTREEDGVGVCAGACLGGRRPLMAIQSSGLGNMLNALMSLTRTYDLPLPILASWRGIENETIPAQVPFNAAVPGILDATGIPYTVIRTSSEFSKIGDVITDAFANSRPHVALVMPGSWVGQESCYTPVPPPARRRDISLKYNRNFPEPMMSRNDAIQVIARHLDRQAVVANIGVPSKELYAANDRPLNFYMLGSYTQASPIGLGLATTTRRDVWVIDGDGSILGTGILPVIGAERPENLTVFGLDNGSFGSTGNQPTPAYLSTDIEMLAIASGFPFTVKTGTPEGLESILGTLGRGPNFVHVVLKPGNADVKNIPLFPHQIRDRFVAAIR